MADVSDAESSLPAPREFTTTHWSVVLAAGQGCNPQAAAALEQLCRAYWYPLYAYIRRQGHSPEDAQDLTQGFFAQFLESDALGRVSPDKGRFRSYLLACCNHFLANAWKQGRTLKRGGGYQALPMDEAAAEGRYQVEPATDLTPEKLFERRWALALLDQALGRLQAEWRADGKEALFQAMRVFLSDVKGAVSYAETSRETGLSEAAARQAVHRLRLRYRELLREEIARTVESPSEIDDEIRHLFAAFG
jgi:RNA polymerase sigma-70 factor (ECF subfamily)